MVKGKQARMYIEMIKADEVPVSKIHDLMIDDSKLTKFDYELITSFLMGMVSASRGFK